jgi:hypothetical protein
MTKGNATEGLSRKERNLHSTRGDDDWPTAPPRHYDKFKTTYFARAASVPKLSISFGFGDQRPDPQQNTPS